MNIAKKLVEEFGLRDEEIAVKTGATFVSVYKWRLGKVDPQPAFQRKLEQILQREQVKKAKRETPNPL